MATFHMNIKAGKSGNAGNHLDYILREGKYKNRINDDDKRIVYRRCPVKGNMETLKDFFKDADKYERKNGTPYKEIEFALPNELTIEQNNEIVKEFCNKYMHNKYFIAVIHDKKISTIENKQNVHCHLMFSERIIDNIERNKSDFFKRYNSKNPEKGGAKKDRFFTDYKTRSKHLKQARKDLEIITNKILKKYNIQSYVSCETLKIQSKIEMKKGNKIKAKILDRKPEQHIHFQILNNDIDLIYKIRKLRKLKNERSKNIEYGEELKKNKKTVRIKQKLNFSSWNKEKNNKLKNNYKGI